MSEKPKHLKITIKSTALFANYEDLAKYNKWKEEQEKKVSRFRLNPIKIPTINE